MTENGNGTKKSHGAILRTEIDEGTKEFQRTSGGLLLSGLSAGLDVGFSVLVLGVVMTTAAQSTLEPVLVEMLKASAYSVGFILVIFGRVELFTEQTTLAVLPVLDRRASLRQLARVWGLIYSSNMVGAVCFAFVMAWLGPALGVIDAKVLDELAKKMVSHSTAVMAASAVLAGWLMGLVSWLVAAGRDTVSQLLFVWIITGAIGLCGLHHCIVGSVEVLGGLFAGDSVSWSEFAKFLVVATLGNAVGGSVFVAILKFAHARADHRRVAHTASH